MPEQDEMAKRQQVLADFGEFAIRSQDLDEVLMEACRLVGEATGTGRAKVLEIQEGGEELLLRAGVGWAANVVGKVRLQMNERSSETYSIRAGEPVFSQDISREDRFDVPAFMKDAGVVALVNVPIFVPGERPYGILQVDDTRPREFGEDEIQFLRTYATILGPVIDRLHLVEERRAMRERMFADLDSANESFSVSFHGIDQRKEAEMEFLRIISLLRTTFDNSQQIIQLFRAVRDERDTIVDFEWVLTNKQWNDRWGPKTGKRLLTENPAVVQTGVWAKFIQVMETGNPITHEHYYAHEQFDGWFAQTIAKAGDGILLSSLDVTEQKRTERALSESEASYRALFDSIDEGFCIIEVLFDEENNPVDYRFLEANASFERQTGLEDAVGKRMRELQPAHEQHWFDIYGRIALTGEPRRFEARADALGRWYSVYAFRVDAPERRRVAILFDDIGERKRSEEALRASEDKYRTIFESIDEGFALIEVILDDEGTPVDLLHLETNPAYEHHTGLRDIVGKRALEIAPDFDPMWFDFYGRVARTGEAARSESFIAPVDRWITLHASRVGGEGSRKVAVVFNDITERKRAEEALREDEERQKFLLRLSDALRAEPGVDAMALFALGALAEQLQLDRCYIAEYRLEEDRGDIPYQVGNERVPPFPDSVRLSDFPKAFEIALGRTLIIDDVNEADFLSDEDKRNMHALGIHALVTGAARKGENVPLFCVVAVSAVARQWTAGEVALVEEATERTWAAIDLARAEARLRESEERLRQFGEAAQDVLWIRNVEAMQWTYLTPAFEAIYGLAREEALTGDNFRSWLKLIVPEDRPQAVENIRRVREGEHVTFEYRIRRPVDGEVRWLRNTDFPLVGADGAVKFIGGIGSDITEAKRTQELLERSEERLRSAVEVGRLGLWDWNVLTGEIHWSDEHFRMGGYAVGEVRPSYEAWAARIHPDDRPGAEAALRGARDAHEEFDHEFRTVHPDGSVHWLHGLGRFFYDETGQAVRMVGAMTDTTARREWEERQAVLVAELQHRTRNLIAVVRSMADKTMRRARDLPDFRDSFRDRLEALARVQGLLSRLEEHDRVTFDELIHAEMVGLGAFDESAERVTLTGPEGIRLRSSTVQTLAMALHELATNAVKYGALRQPDGRLAISWQLEPQGDQGRPWLRVDWRESGVVMPEPGAAPQGTGQGRELIERALPYQLQARTRYEVLSDGIHCRISLPLSASTTAQREAVDARTAERSATSPSTRPAETE